MATATAEHVARWIGWRRHTGEKWQAVASGKTYDEAWQALHAVRLEDHVGGDNLILREGEDPNQRTTR